MGNKVLSTGCIAIANAVKLVDADVISAYPIRPYTGVMNALAQMIADGEFDAEYIIADSEHTQFEVAKHASACGARVFTGTAGIGWAFAHESIVVTPTNRVPVVAMLGNRALDDPGAFGTEHTEAMITRDIGWMICWPENPQEALDMTLMGYRIAEDPNVLLPIAVCADGNFVTHVHYPVEIPDKEQVQEFLPPYEPLFRLHPDKPLSIAPQVDHDWGFEIRKQLDDAMENAREVIKKAHKDFNRIFGRGGDPFVEEYMTEDAEVALVGIGATSMVAKATIRKLRKEGTKIGYVKIKRFRPFPGQELINVLRKFKVVGVIDIDFSFGSPTSGAILYNDIRAALYDLSEKPILLNFIIGLAGREITPEIIKHMSKIVVDTARKGKAEKYVYWIGVRE